MMAPIKVDFIDRLSNKGLDGRTHPQSLLTFHVSLNCTRRNSQSIRHREFYFAAADTAQVFAKDLSSVSRVERNALQPRFANDVVLGINGPLFLAMRRE